MSEKFLVLVRDHGATAVPLDNGLATAWAGVGIRRILYVRREVQGNALLMEGRLRFGAPVIDSNAVQIEVVE